MNSELVDFLNKCEAISNLHELHNSFRAFIEMYGYDNFVVTGIPTVEQTITDVLTISTYPEEWQRIYQTGRYERIDPVSQMSSFSNLPFTWADALSAFHGDIQTSSILEQSREFALNDGLVVPMFDMVHYKSVVAMTSELKLDLPKKIVNSISLAASAYKASIDQLVGTKAPVIFLSPRELEILKWAAVGKSNWDISQILNISQRTVEAHLYSARQKLSAMNTTHAVAKAVRLQLIIP